MSRRDGPERHRSVPRFAPPNFVAIVVPAHDEADRIGACLASIERASNHASMVGIEVLTIVVADACSDTTAERATAAGAMVFEISAGSVGQARDFGMRRALAKAAGRAPADIWLASTDADSLVPSHWLSAQRAWSGRGFDAVAGTVRVADWSEHSKRARTAFVRRQHAIGTGDGHGHIHGANLALSGGAFVAAGGVPHQKLGEDEELWRRVRVAGARTIRAGGLAVVTSARREARAEGGFAHLLRSL